VKIGEQSILEALLDSWSRNNTILLNLLHAVPEGGLEARVMANSPSVAEMFTHIHYVRMVFISEDAPEFGREIRYQEWMKERDPGRIARCSARVRNWCRMPSEAGFNQVATWTSTMTTRFFSFNT
jgi:hypothetical protein